VTIPLFTSGCPFEDVPSGLYKVWEIPLVLSTTPRPHSILINDGDPRITYEGDWRASTQRGFHDHHDDVHYTTSMNDSLQFAFHGTGIEYLAEKHGDFGNVDVFLDGELKQNVNLRLENFPRLSQVVVFRAAGLKDGPHTIRIVNRSSAAAVVDAFRVYGGAAEPLSP
jgi:hypothetical protein